jgi:hypothetical protein
VDGSDDNTVVNVCLRDSGPPASPHPLNKHTTIQQWLWDIQDSLMHSCPPEGEVPPGLPQILELSTATHMLWMDIRDGNMKAQCDGESCLFTIEDRVNGQRNTAMVTPPPAISTTTTEVIDFSIEFGFAVLYYVVLEISRMLQVDSIAFHRNIRVFTRFSRILSCPAIFACPTSRNGCP